MVIVNNNVFSRKDGITAGTLGKTAPPARNPPRYSIL